MTDVTSYFNIRHLVKNASLSIAMDLPLPFLVWHSTIYMHGILYFQSRLELESVLRNGKWSRIVSATDATAHHFRVLSARSGIYSRFISHRHCRSYCETSIKSFHSHYADPLRIQQKILFFYNKKKKPFK